MALNVFGQAFQKHLDSYKRPDHLPMNARVIMVDPGLSRTPGTRRWLTRGSLAGLALYPRRLPGASILYAAMDGELGRGPGGKLVKECMEVDYARAEVRDDEVAKTLWQESDALIERVEKAQAKKRAVQKAEKDKQEQEDEARRKAEELGGLVDAIKKGKEREKQAKKQKGATKTKAKGGKAASSPSPSS
ncbi:hypothetical protein ACCO45_011940 [Purpureocillium lilacinum]|uniref:Uncharacterized protein n=1 Tax=Purpureocillium lilacinum TaxID=33203 RepID=A0ACC4DEJ7_PURLI